MKIKQIHASLAGLNNLKEQSTDCESQGLCYTSLTFWIVTKKKRLKAIQEQMREYFIFALYRQRVIIRKVAGKSRNSHSTKQRREEYKRTFPKSSIIRRDAANQPNTHALNWLCHCGHIV